MAKIPFFLVVALMISLSPSFVISDDDADEFDIEATNHEFDVLLFTQQWPVTTCFHWLEDNAKKGCNLPKQSEFWTIHGIWPTKYGSMGPSFCNKSASFNPELLHSIDNELKQFWPSIEVGHPTNSLWKHEWLKHGTCAAMLDDLNDEEKYFSQGLQWRNQFLISAILASAGIHPDSQNTVTILQNAFRKYLNKNPSIHCIYDQKNDISYLSEVRLCFNKTLDLIDCDGMHLGGQITVDYPGGKVNTNCHISKLVHYPSVVPSAPTNSEWKFPFVNLYKLLNFIMWFTL